MTNCWQVSKPDKIRKGNWEVIPLSEAQKIYAATDAFVSWKLFKVLHFIFLTFYLLKMVLLLILLILF